MKELMLLQDVLLVSAQLRCHLGPGPWKVTAKVDSLY